MLFKNCELCIKSQNGYIGYCAFEIAYLQEFIDPAAWFTIREISLHLCLFAVSMNRTCSAYIILVYKWDSDTKSPLIVETEIVIVNEINIIWPKL